MRVVNARLGFANNSSSSHSMIIVPKKDYARIATSGGGGDYGWDDFTLATAESKLDYLARAVHGQLARQGDSASATVVVRDLFELPDWEPAGYGLDHQSTFELPSSPDGGLIDVGFARAFAQWIQSEGIVVLGGNDNSDGHPMANGSDAMPFGREQPNGHVAKFDEQSGTWTLFNSHNGAKLRMAFEEGEALELEAIKPGDPGAKASAPDQPSGEPAKMGTPELVDVKITDYCDIGCAYCYQGSTVQGKHAKMEDIQALARELFKAGVLEVAIGGGEPTRHPHFPEILETFTSYGIVANFTTRDLSFLNDGLLRERVAGSSKSVAVSISSEAQLEAAKAAWRDAKAPGSSISFQYVMGTASDAEFRKLIGKAVKDGDNLTLLGYKDSGRGRQWREGEGQAMIMREGKVQSQSGGWIEAAREAMGDRAAYARICIDTALARECEAEMGAAGIPRQLWHKSEGLVSMYVDAVAMTMGKSSYEAPESMEAFGSDWLQRFASWTPTAEESARSKPSRGIRRA